MYNLKSLPSILSDMVAKIMAETPINDIRPGSTILTLLEAVANEDAQQYVAMLNLINNFNLDSTTGDDLSERALEHGLERLGPLAATGYVAFENTAITKRHSVLYAASPSPAEGAVTLDVELNSDVALFPASGYVWVGRGTLNCEKVQYGSITTHTDYYTLNLTSGTLNAHGTEATVILSQAASAQTIPLGTEVYVPATDLSAKISFVTKEAAGILDGESSITDVRVECSTAGSVGNVPINAISEITSPPIATITVTNDTSFVNGGDDESDQELRDRIRSTIQSLSRGTQEAILNKIARISDATEHKSVVSSTYVEATELGNPSYIYIDDGTGFEPSWAGTGYEEVIIEAPGTERFLSLDSFPIMKAALVTNNSEPYALAAGTADTLTIYVGDETETLTLLSTAFKNMGAATAEEVAAHINDISTLVEARTTNTGSSVIISPIAIYNEHVMVTGGTANSILGFPANQYRHTLNLYKNDVLLSKDGSTALLETVAPLYPRFGLTDGDTLIYSVDGKSQVLTVTFSTGDFLDIANATAAEVAAAINANGVGITAIVTANENVRILGMGEPSASSRIVIGAGTANVALGLAPAQYAVGSDKDYVLNRYNGQIELTAALTALDTITAGTSNTRAYRRCTSPEMYTFTGAETIDISIDGGGAVTHSFAALTGSYTALEVANDFNSDAGMTGAIAFVKTINNEDYLCIRTNTQDSGTGSISIDASLSPSLDFPTGTVACQDPSMGYSESGIGVVATPFNIGRNQNLVIILDSDSINRIWNLALQSSGTNSDAAATTTSFADNTLDNTYPTDDVFINAEVQFDAATATAALRNEKATIDSYNGTTGAITVTAGTAFPVAPAVGDTFKIYPRTAKNVVDLLNNAAFTSLSSFADIEVSRASTLGTSDRVQITTKTYGEAGAVQISGGTANNFSIPFASNGTSAGTFTVNSITGLSEGLCPILYDSTPSTNNTSYIKSITGSSAPYTIAMRTIVAPNISIYHVADAATIVSPAILFTGNGSANGTFEVGSIAGLTLGMAIEIDSGAEAAFPCFIRHIVGVGAPYTITVEVAPDLTAFTTDQAALVEDKNGLDFSTLKNVGVDAYKYLTGLAREVQWQIDGLDSDPENYPGIKAAGTQLEVKAPVIKLIDFEIDITPSPGTSVNDVANDVRSAVASYVNRSGVGADIILSEVVAAIHQINLIDDVVIVSPTSNIIIQDTELPRTNEVLIALG